MCVLFECYDALSNYTVVVDPSAFSCSPKDVS